MTVATHLMDGGRSLCGQATEAGSGEPCRTCAKAQEKRARERVEAERRVVYFAQFVAGRLVLVESRNQTTSGYYRITEQDDPASSDRPWIELVSPHGKEAAAQLMRECWPCDGTVFSWQIRRRSGGSQGCRVELVAEAVRDPSIIGREMERMQGEKHGPRYWQRRSYLAAELQAARAEG